MVEGGNILQTVLLNVSVFESQNCSALLGDRNNWHHCAKAYMSVFQCVSKHMIILLNCASEHT